MNLNRTGSLWNRDNRNGINQNWGKIEDGLRSFSNLSGEIESFIDNFNGENLLEKSYNLFNKNAVVKGRLSPTTGELIVIPEEVWVTSEFIPVDPGKRLQIKPAMGVTVMYDSDYNYVGQVSAAAHPMILPNNVRYIRNTMNADSAEDKYIYLGDNDLPYVEYGYSYSDKLISIIQTMVDSPNDVPEYVNLFDKNKVEPGQLTNGQVTNIDGGFLVSDFIKVSPGKRLNLLPGFGVTAMYDRNFNYIRNITTAENPIILPSDARYIRNTMSQVSVDGKYIYLGEEHMDYFPYGEGPGDIGKDGSKPLKILIIGNSYSVDTFTHLHDICKSAGINVVVGVAHESGGSLSDAMDKIRKNETIHSYYKWTNQKGYVRVASPLIDYTIKDEPWDIVLFQQMSFDSLDYNTFQPHLNDLKAHVKTKISNPNVRFGINAIWARATTSETVGNEATQIEQFNTIVENYKTAMYDSDLEILIPTGTAIQNGRANEYLSQVGIELTRDNAHLDEPVGRYIAAMTVFYTLFGESAFGDVSFKTSGTNGYLIYLAKMVAKKAVDNPYKISEL